MGKAQQLLSAGDTNLQEIIAYRDAELFFEDAAQVKLADKKAASQIL